MQSASRLPHLVRGTSAAAIATFAALFSHVLAGGAMPEPLGICVPFVLSLLVSVLLSGRRLSLARLSLSVVASQTLFHTLFVLGAPSSSGGPAAALANAHQHHGAAAMPMPLVTDQQAALIQGDAVMWFSHIVGAVITILFLYRGEQAIHALRALGERLVAWAQLGLAEPLSVPAVFRRTAAPTIGAGETAGWAVLAQLTASARSLRGPPRPRGAAS